MDRQGCGNKADAVGVNANPTNGFIEALKNDNESLLLFIKKMAQFDKMFCDMMAGGADFTIRLEIRGNKGEVLHIRAYTDDIERPSSAGKNSH